MGLTRVVSVCVSTTRRSHSFHKSQAPTVTVSARLSVAEIMPALRFGMAGGSTVSQTVSPRDSSAPPSRHNDRPDWHDGLGVVSTRRYGANA